MNHNFGRINKAKWYRVQVCKNCGIELRFSLDPERRVIENNYYYNYWINNSHIGNENSDIPTCSDMIIKGIIE